jgi:threonine dehydratase
MESLLKDILTARVYDVAVRTPLDRAERLSARLGCEVLLKREDLQPCFSFKVRGAHNRIAHLSEAERKRGVICASAGNHAQGVALSARHLGLAATVVMPVTTPRIKVDAVRGLGAEVVLTGDSYSDAYAHCQTLVHETGRVFIHPFDDPLVIAGQGTIGHELLQQCAGLDAVYVPVGGGGLIAGIAAFIKALRPETRVIGVNAQGSEAMRQSLQAERRVTLNDVALFADGVAVKQVGALAFEIARACVDEIVTVNTDEICSAIKAIYEDTRSIVEPAGALGVAGLLRHSSARDVRGQTLAAINSGANMNFERLHFVAERTRTGEKREALFAVTIPERPGALRAFCEQVVGDHAITEFNYRLSERTRAHIFVGVAVRGDDERRALSGKLEQAGFPALDITGNELAKSHVRHMVGGHSSEARREVLYAFEFPERPRALADFLRAMHPDWNISLFHYRMHGADFGRVLVGFEIPEGDEQAFQAYLDGLHYPYFNETENPAYRMFL